MIGMFGRGLISGYGAITATSVTTSGDIQGAIVRGTTALEFPAHASAPGVRCSTDTDTGIGRTAANELDIICNAESKILCSSGQAFFLGTHEVVVAGEFETRGKKVRTARTVDIDAAGDTIDVSFGLQEIVEVTLSAGNITSTATPFMANGDNGQEITIVNVDATDTLTLPDEATTPGSNLELRAGTRVLAAAGGYIRLRYSTALSAWHEIGFG